MADSSIFLTVPIEIRLEVYRHCSAFTLLLLCHTCRQIYTDINTNPAIYKSSFGYLSPQWRDYWNVMPGNTHNAILRRQQARTSPHLILPRETPRLCMALVARIDDAERDTLRLFSKRENVVVGRWCSCDACGVVGGTRANSFRILWRPCGSVGSLQQFLSRRVLRA
ncbi:hypothetical protein BJ508DRAFT_159335 [Ascobolus immersus RN42]|uniref:F-box domain-containing protein n=1 Tax=Ascobolus immersus RN42 TaxID=1160509 RepID=A0A3N4IPD9_ASCIM|nr:hypothetical protein BJ508DRAFT_159335 [Ascobolus immersus RN42]